MPITYFRQNDPRWENVFIYGTKLPLWRWGCTISMVCTLLSSRGSKITPGELARKPGLFTKDGKIIWKNLVKATGGEVEAFEWRNYGRNNKRITGSVFGDATEVCGIEVELKDGKHWVAALRVIENGADYWIADPIDGRRKQLMKAYPKITGSVHLKLR